jgi:hypothetical protein
MGFWRKKDRDRPKIEDLGVDIFLRRAQEVKASTLDRIDRARIDEEQRERVAEHQRELQARNDAIAKAEKARVRAETQMVQATAAEPDFSDTQG